jgi:hypothetical protein
VMPKEMCPKPRKPAVRIGESGLVLSWGSVKKNGAVRGSELIQWDWVGVSVGKGSAARQRRGETKAKEKERCGVRA